MRQRGVGRGGGGGGGGGGCRGGPVLELQQSGEVAVIERAF